MMRVVLIILAVAALAYVALVVAGSQRESITTPEKGQPA